MFPKDRNALNGFLTSIDTMKAELEAQQTDGLTENEVSDKNATINHLQYLHDQLSIVLDEAKSDNERTTAWNTFVDDMLNIGRSIRLDDINNTDRLIYNENTPDQKIAYANYEDTISDNIAQRAPYAELWNIARNLQSMKSQAQFVAYKERSIACIEAVDRFDTVNKDFIRMVNNFSERIAPYSTLEEIESKLEERKKELSQYEAELNELNSPENIKKLDDAKDSYMRFQEYVAENSKKFNDAKTEANQLVEIYNREFASINEAEKKAAEDSEDRKKQFIKGIDDANSLSRRIESEKGDLNKLNEENAQIKELRSTYDKQYTDARMELDKALTSSFFDSGVTEKAKKFTKLMMDLSDRALEFNTFAGEVPIAFEKFAHLKDINAEIARGKSFVIKPDLISKYPMIVNGPTLECINVYYTFEALKGALKEIAISDEDRKAIDDKVTTVDTLIEAAKHFSVTYDQRAAKIQAGNISKSVLDNYKLSEKDLNAMKEKIAGFGEQVTKISSLRSALKNFDDKLTESGLQIAKQTGRIDELVTNEKIKRAIAMDYTDGKIRERLEARRKAAQRQIKQANTDLDTFASLIKNNDKKLSTLKSDYFGIINHKDMVEKNKDAAEEDIKRLTMLANRVRSTTEKAAEANKLKAQAIAASGNDRNVVSFWNQRHEDIKNQLITFVATSEYGNRLKGRNSPERVHNNSTEFKSMIESIKNVLSDSEVERNGQPVVVNDFKDKNYDNIIEKLTQMRAAAQHYINKKNEGIHMKMFASEVREVRLSYARNLVYFANNAIEQMDYMKKNAPLLEEKINSTSINKLRLPVSSSGVITTINEAISNKQRKIENERFQRNLEASINADKNKNRDKNKGDIIIEGPSNV